MPPTKTKAELRKLAGLSQVDLAGLLGQTQSAVSRYERGPSQRLGTLALYVQALGGALELRVVLGGKEFILDDRETPKRRRKVRTKKESLAIAAARQVYDALVSGDVGGEASAWRWRLIFNGLPGGLECPEPEALRSLLLETTTMRGKPVREAFERYLEAHERFSRRG